MKYRCVTISLHPAIQADFRALVRRRTMTMSEYVRRLIRLDLASRSAGAGEAPVGGLAPPVQPPLLPPSGAGRPVPRPRLRPPERARSARLG